jgi:nitrate reductase beta subunit
MDNLQNRIGRISRPVWLHSLDDGPVRSGDALYYSVFDGLFKFLRSTTDGKDDPLVRRYSVLAGQRPNGVIKTRPELMNNLSSNDRNSQRDWRPQDFEGVSATFRLTLSDDRISAAVQESGDLVIEITDLLFGPLNLGPAPVEGV